MKRLIKSPAGLLRPLAFLFVAALVFTACKKTDDSMDYPAPPTARLMAFNLAPDKAAVGFTLSNNELRNTALNFTEFTGGYLPVYAGSREVRSVDYYTGSTLATTPGNFADSMYYSVFVVGYNGSYRNVLLQDDLNAPVATPGKAWVRYINAIADSTASPTVSIGEGAINTAAPYASVSAFTAVNAGQVAVSVNNGGSINASRNITLEAGKIYTILLAGIPGATDPNKQVQIRFINNGTITP